MSPIDSKELYKRIWDIDTKVKVFIFTATDLTFDEIRKISSSFEEQCLIKKPISLQILFQQIESVMI
jgi:hypothetical protein